MRRVVAQFLALAAFGATPSCARAAFVFQTWQIGVDVNDASTGHLSRDIISQITNPLDRAHMVTLNTPVPSTSAAEYHFGWNDSGSGVFDVTSSQRAYDVSSLTLFSRATGNLIFSSTVPIRLDLSAFYDYDLPPDAFVADLQFSVTGGLLFRSRQADSFGGHAVGRLSIQDSVIIPGDGIQRSINYLMRIQSFAGHTGTIGVGSGNVHWTLTPLPEPATAALLLPASLILLRRRQRAR